MPLLNTFQDLSKQLSGGQSLRAEICHESTETVLHYENVHSEDVSLNNGAAISDEPMMASGQADETCSYITGTVVGADPILVENIQAANVSLSGGTIAGDMRIAAERTESELSEAASLCAGTAVGPAPSIVDNMHADNVPQQSEPTEGPVPKIADTQPESAFADAASLSAETTADPTHVENVHTDTTIPNLEAANPGQECQDKNTRKARQNARCSRRRKANQHKSRRDVIGVVQEAYGAENKGVPESSYEPTRAQTSLHPDDDCVATDTRVPDIGRTSLELECMLDCI